MLKTEGLRFPGLLSEIPKIIADPYANKGRNLCAIISYPKLKADSPSLVNYLYIIFCDGYCLGEHIYTIQIWLITAYPRMVRGIFIFLLGNRDLNGVIDFYTGRVSHMFYTWDRDGFVSENGAVFGNRMIIWNSIIYRIYNLCLRCGDSWGRMMPPAITQQ